VAAATGAGVLHLGTDGGGSIRIPAAFTGIVGLKPTFGRVPAYPASAFGTVAHLGPIARTAADAFTMLAAMSGTDRLDWFQGPGTLPALERGHVDFKGMRIAYWRDPPVGHLDAEIGTALDGVLALLEKAGARIEPVTLPEPDLLSIFEVLWFSSAANRVSQFNAEQRRLIDPALMEAAALPGKWSAVDYVRATNQRTAFGLRMDDLLEKFDLLVSPATALLPFEAGEEKPQGMQRWTEWAGFSFPLNLSQQPAIVVPCGRSFGGLPIGVQFVAARGADAKVVAAAQAFEALRPASFL
jgi:amidase/aspartyl-tRNA(Asn)/glutamyl-tRNA(Gln) amidotransferase subunit A